MSSRMQTPLEIYIFDFWNLVNILWCQSKQDLQVQSALNLQSRRQASTAWSVLCDCIVTAGVSNFRLRYDGVPR
ncbi:hypothetical protein OUZ56_002658 [Daphnia magna]|uniref:Uncharacterized protein n=1 Tax=Daphnia magna TaxID=35525 RepID=A0ABR0A6C6_9CRUS|nr:hypothetical protein OUZ56_002658 [Daphnia magna]